MQIGHVPATRPYAVRPVPSNDRVGGDMVEVSPPFDQSGNTALVGANLNV